MLYTAKIEAGGIIMKKYEDMRSNWEFGEAGLERIIRSFINDFMPDSVWAEKK